MTKYELGILISRVFALVFLVKSIAYIAGLIGVFSGDLYIIIISLSFFITPLSLFLLFWFKAGFIGRKIVEPMSESKISAPSYEHCMHIVFVLFGLWLLSRSIPHITNLLGHLISDGIIEGKKIQGFNIAEQIGLIGLYIIFGLFCIVRTNGIVRMISFIRNAG